MGDKIKLINEKVKDIQPCMQGIPIKKIRKMVINNYHGMLNFKNLPRRNENENKLGLRQRQQLIPLDRRVIGLSYYI